MDLTDLATDAGQSAALWLVVAGLWLLVTRLEARAHARRELLDRQRHWR